MGWEPTQGDDDATFTDPAIRMPPPRSPTEQTTALVEPGTGGVGDASPFDSPGTAGSISIWKEHECMYLVMAVTLLFILRGILQGRRRRADEPALIRWAWGADPALLVTCIAMIVWEQFVLSRSRPATIATGDLRFFATASLRSWPEVVPGILTDNVGRLVGFVAFLALVKWLRGPGASASETSVSVSPTTP